MINTNYSGSPYPAGKPAQPAQATYSDEGHEIAQNSLDYYNKFYVSASKGDAAYLKNFETILQSPDTTSTEKLLAKLGKELGETSSEAKIRGAIRSHFMNIIACQAQGPIGVVLATLSDNINNDHSIPWGSEIKITDQSFSEIINSPGSSEKDKDLARLGQKLSKVISSPAAAGTASNHVMHFIKKQYSSAPVAEIALLCSSLERISELAPSDRDNVLNTVFDTILQHPGVTPEETTLAQFGKSIKDRSSKTNFAKRLVTGELASASKDAPGVKIFDIAQRIFKEGEYDENELTRSLASRATPEERDPWTGIDEIVKSGLEFYSRDKSASNEDRLFGKLVTTVIDSGKFDSPRGRFYKGFLNEIRKTSGKPLHVRITEICTAATKEAHNAEENREFLTACFKVLNSSDLTTEFKSILEKGIEIGESSALSVDIVVDQQMAILQALPRTSEKNVLKSTLEAVKGAQADADSPEGGANDNIRMKEDEVNVDGVVLKKKKRVFSSLASELS